MAMTGTKRSNLDNILLRLYWDKRIINLINMRLQVMPMFQRETMVQSEGEFFRYNVKTRQSDAGGHRGEGHDVVRPDTAKHEWLDFNYAKYQRTIRLSVEAVTSGGALVEPLQRDMTDAIEAARLDTERDLWVPKSGLRCNILSASSANTFVIDDFMYVTEGMRIDILDKTTGIDGQGVSEARITSLIKTKADGKATVTIDKNMGDYSYVNTNAAFFGVYRNGEFGLQGHSINEIISDVDPSTGPYGGLSRSTEQLARALSIDAGYQPISIGLLADLMTEMEIDGTGEPSFGLMHPYNRNKLVAEARADVRYRDNITKFERWGRGITMNGMNFVAARFCPKDAVYFMNFPDWTWALAPGTGQGKWFRNGLDSGPIFRSVANKDMWEALWIRRSQIICRNIRRQGVLKNLRWHYHAGV